MGKITMKSTKQEIMDAYEAAMKQIEEANAIKDDPLASAKAEEDKRVEESAQMIIEDNILNPTIVARYEDLKVSISKKKKELLELYGIETKANSFVALINAYKDKETELNNSYETKKKELEDAMAIKATELRSDISDLEAEKRSILNSITEEGKELKEALTKERDREQEEYEYEKKRSRKLDNDKWFDEKVAREKELAERELAIKEDEQEIAEKISYIEELEQKVESIPQLIQDAKSDGYELGRNDANKSNVFEVRALKQQNEYSTQILEDKINRLSDEVNSLKDEKNDLQNKLDEAYLQMRNLAADTVKSTGGVHILNGQNNTTNK